MAPCIAASPRGGTKKVMEMSLLVFLEPFDSSMFMALCWRRVERMARYLPGSNPVMINELLYA
ncbi:hypothetical protein Hanom_Chr09g00823581 [Helianthus anomalus]